MKPSWLTLNHLLVAGAVILSFFIGKFTTTPETESADNEKPRKISRGRNPTSPPPGQSTTSTPSRKTSTTITSSNIPTLADLEALSKQGHTLASGNIHAAILNMSLNQIESLAHDCINTNNQNYYISSGIFSRWAQLDPQAALQFAKSSDSQIYKTALGSILTTIARTDPTLALAEAKKVKDTTFSTSLRLSVLNTMATSHPDAWVDEILTDPTAAGIFKQNPQFISSWFKDNPQAALARLKRLPKHTLSTAVHTIASSWASHDLAAARQWANTLENPTQRNQALNSIITVTATKDPDTALSLLKDLPVGMHGNAISNIYRNMATSDPMKAFEKAMSLSNASHKHHALSGLISSNYIGYGHRGSSLLHQSRAPMLTLDQLQTITSQLPMGHLRDAALGQISAYLNHMPSEKTDSILSQYSLHERKTMATHIIQNTCITHPERALELYQRYPPGHHAGHIYSRILSSLAATQPEKSLNLAIEHDIKTKSPHTISRILEQLNPDQFPDAIQHLNNIGDESLRNKALTNAASRWANKDLKAALGWARNLPDAQRSNAITSILPALTRNNPQHAIRELSFLHKDDDQSYARSVRNIAYSWGDIDPQAAAAWADSLTRESSKKSAVASITSTWAREDIKGAATWINNMPNGKTRDAGVLAIIAAIQNREPETSFQWALSISDENNRLSQLDNIVSNWKRHGKEKAHQAIENANLTDKEYERLSNQLK